MMNKIETYRSEGVKAGKTSMRDPFMSRFICNWATRAFMTEKPEDREQARKAWTEGYKEGSGANDKPNYFP